jgi:hypothetical protein
LAVLGCPADPVAVRRAARAWGADELEAAVVDAGGCAAAMRSTDDWRAHPQGIAVASEPLVASRSTDSVARSRPWRPELARPLSGVRVLDLTRVLAGPVATRFLAGYGADVLRIDPPQWEETIVPEVTLGKRCARLDVATAPGLERLRSLLAECDVVVHGYRPGALARLGLGGDEREAARPGLVDVSLDAYGWSGPWRSRRGFDSLVQMSTGIAERGRAWAGSERPVPLPFQALDQATGYLMAAAVLEGLQVRMTTGHGWRARCSLARTAQLLFECAGTGSAGDEADPPQPATAEKIEQTPWGPARRLVPPVILEGAPMWWDRAASALGSSPPAW